MPYILEANEAAGKVVEGFRQHIFRGGKTTPSREIVHCGATVKVDFLSWRGCFPRNEFFTASTVVMTRRRSEAEGTQSEALGGRVDRMVKWPRAETQCARLHFFLFVRCVSAEPAAVFVDLLDPALRSAVDAAAAAFVDVTFGGALC